MPFVYHNLHQLSLLDTVLGVLRSRKLPTFFRSVDTAKYTNVCDKVLDNASNKVSADKSATPTSVLDVSRVERKLNRPPRMRYLTVVVPSDLEKECLPDLPNEVIRVHPELPTEEDWGSSSRMAIRRLQYLKAVDLAAYKCEKAKGSKTPLPPKLRA